jgi:tetratricopeptide (TPR) repeat protein
MIIQNKSSFLRYYLVALLNLFLVLTFPIFAQTLPSQNAKKQLREGNENYLKNDFKAAEEKYIMALNQSSDYFTARYNLANNYYKQKRYKEASESYESLIPQATTNDMKAKLWHNLGNSQLQAEQYEKSIVSYKNALRINPSDAQTRYNLAYAQQKLKKQQNQNQQNKDQQNKDQQNKDQQNKDQQNKDQQNKDQQNKDQQNKDQQNKDQQDKAQQNKDQQNPANQNQGKGSKMDPKEAEKLLKAMAEKEKNTKEKVDKQLIRVSSKKVEKDW